MVGFGNCHVGGGEMLSLRPVDGFGVGVVWVREDEGVLVGGSSDRGASKG